MSGEKPKQANRRGKQSICPEDEGGTTHAGKGDSALAGPAGTRPENSGRKREANKSEDPRRRLSAKVFDEFLSRSWLPRFDGIAEALAYAEFYKRAKDLKKYWPRLLRETCRGLWLANHEKIPVTYAQLADAERRHHLAMTKREGRAAPDFASRQKFLRATERGDLADEAANAAKNLTRTQGEWQTRDGVRGWVPRDGLREQLPLLWLPALLWTLDDNGVSDVLRHLRNRAGELVGMETGTPRAIEAVRGKLKLPTAIQLFGKPIAKFDQETARIVFERDFGCDE